MSKSLSELVGMIGGTYIETGDGHRRVATLIGQIGAELDRLRALDLDATHAAVDETMLAKYQAWYEASRPIVEAVANFDETNDGDGAYSCHWCGSMYDGVGDAQTDHLDNCPVTQARALLAKEGEA